MLHEEAVLEIAVIIVDGIALSEAPIAGDLQESRFLAHLMTANAAAMGLCDVQAAAASVVRLLGPAGGKPLPGYAQAVLALSGQFDRALTFQTQ